MHHLFLENLSLCNITSEKSFGLASEFMVKCKFCNQTNAVRTSAQHRGGKRGPLAYDINSRAVLGSLHTGIGETHLNNLLSTMNIPTMNRVTFKNREREIGNALEKTAKKSCKDSLLDERNSLVEQGETEDSEGCINMKCSFDMGWQKRGKGHNSSTGQGAVMSLSSGKIMDYTTRTKTCRFCTYAKKHDKIAKKHDCRKNHFSSSKAMEPEAAVHLFNDSLKYKAKFSVYTGDEDSTTAAHLREKVPYSVEKWTDTVHAKRSLTTRLMNLSQRSKFTNSSVLSQKVINYLVKCFSYSVSQNKGNPEKLKQSLSSIVPHAFGKHNLCSELWCRANNDNYKHSDLPYGKDLHGKDLEIALQRIFDEYCTDLVIKKLSPAANSQRNESLNSVIGSKTPKIRFYGGSESNDFRVACGVSQVNLGYQYINQTLESLNIEPGKHCEIHNKKMDAKTTKEKERKSTLDVKRRRSQLQKNKVNLDIRKQSREGATYRSNIGLNLDISKSSEITASFYLANNTISNEQLKKIETLIPPYIVRPVSQKYQFSRNNIYNFVVYDIETNSTGKKAEICQLSAINHSGSQTFNTYVLPTNDIDIYATRVNGLSISSMNGHRMLMKENNPVESVSLDNALDGFLDFIQSTIEDRILEMNSNITTQTIITILIGHNSQVFDAPTLLRQGTHPFCDKLSKLNVFFNDTLPIVKKYVNNKHAALRLQDGSMSKCNQASIYNALFHNEYEAHDALEDVKALRKIVFDSSLDFSNEILVKDMVSVKNVIDDTTYLDKRHERLQSFKGKLFHEREKGYPVTKCIAEKIAGSGLCYDDLRNVFTTFGEMSLVAILSLPPSTSKSKVPRVTKTSRILVKIVDHFKSEYRE